MKITANSGCYLTEVAEVAPDKRTFRNMVIVATVEEAAGWKQITEQEKAALESQGAIFGSQDVTPEYLGRVDTLLTGIAERINDTPMTAEWVPGTGTESLYKVVQEEHEGTKDDPIPWQLNMELYNGKYYTDKGVKYLCIRDSGMGLSFALADLVSGGFVQVVNE